MAKGPKAPRTRKEILDRIIVLALDKSNLLGKAIRAKLEDEFDPSDIPGLRTVQLYVSNARKQAEVNVQEEPWSLATMDKVCIPWEAVQWLQLRYMECAELQQKGEQLWPWTTQFQEAKALPRVILTNRQAKWLWRLHLVVPLPTPEFLTELCEYADLYAHREMTAEYLGRDFDTSDLDSALLNIQEQIKMRGIPTKTKKDQVTKREE